MTQDKPNSGSSGKRAPYQKVAGSNYYTLLGLHPAASVREIRQTYRELSKLYHPDTTALPSAIATEKFQRINEAYATLSNPDRRTAYDQKIGYSHVVVAQPLPTLNKPQPSSSAYLDPTDRPLSAGEIFALFILGLTFVACLVLAVTIGLTRGEAAFKPLVAQDPVIQEAFEILQPPPDSRGEPKLERFSPLIETPVIETPINLTPSSATATDPARATFEGEEDTPQPPEIAPIEFEAVTKSNDQSNVIIESSRSLSHS
ncbi:MAG: J domain-containing protein [Myxacorys chilensis ATA2-1-KO14]|nr:J domain-containing protein [Myxacorys chilensis ATA2-1-KO14]